MKRSIVAWFDRRKAQTVQQTASGDEELCVLPAPLPWQQARRVLVFAPHPDDEAIGCGGLIARLTQAAIPVRVVLVTDGSGAGGLPPGAAQVRQREFLASLERLGVADHRMFDFPDGQLVADAALFDAVSAQVRDFRPDWVVGPSAADAHRDHRCVAQAVQRAASDNDCVQRSLEYETWGTLPATHVLDITDQLAVKMAALAQHVTALAQMDYASAAAGLARYRGLLLREKRERAAAEAYLCTARDTLFQWPAGWGRPS